MRIYYKQPETDGEVLPFSEFGIQNCYLKKFYLNSQNTSKKHHHTGYEIHIIQKGHQIYEAGNEKITAEEGNCLIIPPDKKHKVVETGDSTVRFTFVFCIDERYFSERECALKKVPGNIWENMKFIEEEYKNKKSTSSILIGNRVFESLVVLLRQLGLTEAKKEADVDDDRIAISKQYISDNIKYPITVSELAGYCYMSEKQLTRLFMKNEGITPAEYIRKERALYIEKLLADKSLSLKCISEIMNFNDEYYFNVFVKKYLGDTPGSYRRSIKST